MTSLTVEHFGLPSSRRAVRVLELARRRAVDELAGRTVWSVTALPGARRAAHALRGRLESNGVAAGSLEVPTEEPLRQLAQRLDAMLTGTVRGSEQLGPAERELYDEGARGSERLVGGGVRAGDVVVLHDPLVTVLAQAVRDQGAHAVWHMTVGPPPRAETDAARTFLHDFTSVLDAYVAAWEQPVSRGLLGERLAALMPAADVLAAKDLAAEGGRDEPTGWCCLLADVVQADREQHVGGRLHARPAVATR